MALCKKVSVLQEVPFFDVDSYRVVWHGNYPKYLEIARCRLLQEAGCPYSAMEEMGVFFPVVELQVKYVKPLVFTQKIMIEAWFVEWKHRLKISYQMRDFESHEVLTKARTTQFAVAMPSYKTLFDIPDFVAASVDAWQAS